MLTTRHEDPIGLLAAEPERLREAWAAVREARGAPGVDRQTIEGFALASDSVLRVISDRLRSGTYRFSRLRRAAIPRANGKPRRLGIPTVCDRIVLQAIRQSIEPACERQMLDCSHAYRPGRGAMTAIAQVTGALAAGRHVVLETDVENFFDSICHRTLLADLAGMEPRTRRSKLLSATLALSSGFWASRKGIAQGSPLSPLLANVALTALDRELQSPNWTLVRYADDLVVLCASSEAAELALREVKRALAKRRLRAHPDKTAIVDSRRAAFRFLGFEFHPDHFGPDSANVAKFRDSVLGLCNPHQAADWDSRIQGLNSILRSFAWFYHQADSRRLFWMLDHFVVEQLSELESQIGPPEKPWKEQVVKMARMREVTWLGKSKRKIKGWDGYGS